MFLSLSPSNGGEDLFGPSLIRRRSNQTAFGAHSAPVSAMPERCRNSVTIVQYAAAHEYPDALGCLLPARQRRVRVDTQDRLIRGSATRAAVRDLAERAWDVIHIHTPFRAHQIGVALARRTGVPSVESYHTFFEEYAAHYLPWLPAAWLRLGARRFSRRLCHDVDHLIVPTQQIADVLSRYGITTP